MLAYRMEQGVWRHCVYSFKHQAQPHLELQPTGVGCSAGAVRRVVVYGWADKPTCWGPQIISCTLTSIKCLYIYSDRGTDDAPSASITFLMGRATGGVGPLMVL